VGAPPIEQLPTVPVGERAAVPGRTFAIGTKMGERYQLARFIAAGGMGEVYEAEDTELDVRVALKTLRPGLADDPEALARFRREIHVARAVTHPNVCRVFDLGVHEGPPRTPFLTMELVRGESLAERIAKQPPGRETARAILGQILAGLEAAHRAGVIHRDLTPANILLAKDGERVAITDFGIAVANADAAAAVTAGTPPYMAPEVLGGAPPTAASDLYSLGVVMFQLQTGRLPRVVRTFDEGKTVDFGTPPALDGARWRDRAWEAAMMRCLAEDPAARPASAAAVLPASRAAKRWVAVAIGGALLAGSAVTAVALWPREPVPALRSPSGDAFRAGLAELRELDLPAARRDLRAAAASAPEDPIVLAHLSAAERLAGDPAAARAAADRARAALGADPPPAERALVEARGHEARGAWRQAIASWTALSQLAPALDHRLAIAAAHVALGELEAARRELEAARPIAGADAALVDLAAAAVADRANEFETELALGRSIVGASASRPALAAQGHVAIATAAVYLGDDATAGMALDAAQELFAARDNPLGLAEVTRVRSMRQWLRGDLPAARTLSEQALAISTKAGDLRGQANTLGALSLLANRLGDFAKAIDYAERARAAYTELADQRQIAWSIEQLGNIAYMRDDLPAARERWIEARAVADAAGDRVRAGDLSFNLGEASLVLGDVGTARVYSDEAVAHYQATSNGRGLAETALQAAEIALVRGEADAALGHAKRARDAFAALDQPARLADIAAVEARVALDRGDAAGARATIAGAVAITGVEPSTTFELAVLDALAAVRAGDVPGARAALERAGTAYREPPSHAARLLAAMRARVSAAEGRHAEAAAQSRAVRDGVPAAEPFGNRAELELLLLETERVAKVPGVAARAAQLAQEAADRGYIRAARLARG